MVDVGSVELSVKLDKSKLNQDAAQLQQQLANIKDVQIPVGFKVEANEKLATELGNVAKQGDAIAPSFEKASQAASGLFAKFDQFVESQQKAAIFAAGVSVVSAQLEGLSRRIDSFKDRAVAAFAEYDKASTALKTLPGADVEAVKNGIAGLSGELKNQFSQVELLNGGYDVLSAGFSKTSDAIAVSRAAALAAKGGFTDFGQAVDGISSAINAYRLSSADAGKVADQFVAIQNAGKIRVGEFVDQIGRIAPTAAAANISIADLGGVLATLTNSGVKADQAVTATVSAISALAKPDDQALQLADTLGISFGETALKSKGLIGVLQDIKSKGDLSLSTLTTLANGNLEAAKALLPLIQNLDQLKTNTDAVANSQGAAKQAADIIANSYEGKLTEAANKAKDALIPVGEGAAKVGGVILSAVIPAIDAFNQLPTPVKESAGAIAAITAGLLGVAAAGAAVLAVIPPVAAGYVFLTTAIGANTAAQAANATATAATTTALGAEATAAGTAATATAASGAAAGGASAGFGALAASVALALAPIAALTAAIGLIAVVKNTADLSDFNKGIEALTPGAQTAGDAAIELANKTKLLKDQIGENGKATAEQKAKAQQLIAIDQQQIAAIDDQIKAVQALKPANDEQKNAQQALIANLTASKNALTAQAQGLEGLVDPAKKSAAAIAGLGEKIDQAKLKLKQLQAADQLKAAEFALDKTDRLTAVKEKQAAGPQGSEEQRQASQESNAVEKDSLQKQIAFTEDSIAKIRELKKAGGQAAIEATQQEAQQVQKLSALKSSLADKEVQEKKLANDKILSDLDRRVKRETAAANLKETQGTTAIKQGELSGQFKGLEGEIKQTELAESSAQQRLAIKENELAETKKLRDQGVLGEAEAEAKILQLTQDAAQARLKVVEARIARGLKLVEDIERKLRIAETKSDLSANAATLNVKQTQLAGGIVGEGGQTEIAKIEEANVTRKIATEEKAIAGIKKLQQDRLISEKNATDKILALESTLAQNRLKLVDLQTQRELRAIQTRTDAQKRATDAAVANLNREKAANDNLIASLERQKQVLESRGAKNQAIDAARQSQLKQGIDQTSEAQAIGQQLQSGNIGQNQRDVLQRQLQDLTGSGTADQVALAERKAALEAEADKEKVAALQQQQQLDQAGLELDLQRQDVAAKNNLLEAQRAELLAKQNEVEAAGNLLKAQKTGDLNDIENAKSAVDLAKQGVDIAGQQVTAAQDNLAVQKELQANAKETLAIKQQTAAAELNAANAANARKREVDVAAAKDNRSGAGGGVGGAGGAGGSGAGGGSGQSAGAYFGQRLVDYNRASQTVNDITRSGRTTEAVQQELVRTLASITNQGERQALIARAAEQGFGDLLSKVDRLQQGGINNQKLEQAISFAQSNRTDLGSQLDRLLGAIDKLANTPRSLSVSAPDPIGAIGQITNALANNRLSGARL